MRVVQPDARVLDLACGGGHLSAALRQLAQAREVFGVDLAMSELVIARQRAPGVHFLQARAQALPFPGASLDNVLCNMALMLFDDVEAVVGEVARVLRADGVFGAVTNAAGGMSPVGETIVTALRCQWHMSDPEKRAPALGDPRTQTPEGLRALLSRHFPDVSVQSFTVTQAVPRPSLWQYLTAAAYGLDALPDDVGDAVLGALDLPDPVPWTLPLLLVQGTRARAI